MRYHINNEGKIYPCQAKVQACPYGEGYHADTREELYHVAVNAFRTEDPAKGVEKELYNTGRIKSFYPLSEEIEKSPAPVELITVSLQRAIRVIQEDGYKVLERGKPGHLFETERNVANLVERLLERNMDVPDWVPNTIYKKAYAQFQENSNGRIIEDARETRNALAWSTREELEGLRDECEGYRDWETSHLDKENYNKTLNWLNREFNTYSRALNTSKLITQPLMFGDTYEDLKTQVASMDNFELQATYDDLLISDDELKAELEAVNHFEYSNRDDLSPKANARLKEWYNNNAHIAQRARYNQPRRLLVSLEIANELDRRGLRRSDMRVRKVDE